MKLTHSVRSVSFSVALSLAALAANPACTGSDVTPGGSAGASSEAGASSAGAPSTDICTIDDDCTLSEIDVEITKPSDCMCLYGCVYLPLTKMTAARRALQHDKYCKPDSDGQGQACGIDDCVVPGNAVCVDGTCQVRSDTPDR